MIKKTLLAFVLVSSFSCSCSLGVELQDLKAPKPFLGRFANGNEVEKNVTKAKEKQNKKTFWLVLICFFAILISVLGATYSYYRVFTI